jgi:hypothetical protein
LGDGIAYALTEPGVPDIADRWTAPGADADVEFAAALADVASGATQRGGRLLAPYAVRYLVVPHFDGGQSTASDPIDPPIGLTDALGAQLDLRRLFTSPAFDVFENTAAFPGAASFPGELAAATTVESAAEIVRRDLSEASPVLTGVLETRSATGDVPAGAVTLSVPFDEHWTLDVGDEEVPSRVAFGALAAFDTAAGGAAEMRYETSSSRRFELAGQAVLWLIALLAASRLGVRTWTARRARRADRSTVIDFADDVELPSDSGEVPVMVPLEPVAAGVAQRNDGRPARPLFRADDEAEGAAWVEDMFADEDEL